MTYLNDPKAIADGLRAAASFADWAADGTLMLRAADTIDALVKENTSLEQRIRSTEQERDALMKERDALSAVVEKVKNLVAEAGRFGEADVDSWVNVYALKKVLYTAPADALREHDAALIESLADEWSEWETFTASDGHTSIRQHGLSPDDWLRERARLIREGDKK